MNIKYSPNKISNEDKEITLDSKITTLIWENWSWKSIILEQILNNYFNDEKKFVISYSSWLNESFTKILEKHIENFNSSLTEYWVWKKLKSFYFSSNRAKILIYFACILEKWKTKEYMDKHEFLKWKKLRFNYSIKNNTYKNFMLKAAELDRLWEKSLITSNFHKNLTVFIWTSDVLKAQEIDYTKTLSFKFLNLNNNEIKNIFEIPKEIENEFWENITLIKEEWKKIRNKELLSFLWILFEYLADIDIVKLFIWGSNLNDLSDWEFQMLVIYSLIDLFDSDDTIFLFDEIDSHLHFDNINLLWSTLKLIEWKVITTTHIPDSIINTDIKQIKLVKEWIIDNKSLPESIIKRLDNISQSNFYAKKLSSKIKYIVLVEDESDWFIFIELLKIKIWENKVNDLLEKIDFIKCSSWYDTHNQRFADNKKKWVEEYNSINWKSVLTEKIFFLCDRDNLPINSICNKSLVLVTWEKQKFWNKKDVFVLSWRRKQIENYLLSYNLLNNVWKLNEINKNLIEKFQIKQLENNDNKWVQDLEIKDIIKILYSDDNWIDYSKLWTLIKLIPPEEISEDIGKMYDFIISRI